MDDIDDDYKEVINKSKNTNINKYPFINQSKLKKIYHSQSSIELQTKFKKMYKIK